ncbi:MAG: hypothetical protein ABI855_12205, partial [Bacteroidota bacterium]
EGTQIGDQVVLFGRDGPIAAGKSIRYEVDGKDAVQHLLVDLAPEKSYQIKSSGQVLETKKASQEDDYFGTKVESGVSVKLLLIF